MTELTIMYGVKEFEPSTWKVRRIKGKRTWLNWFPRDQLEFSTDYVVMTGDEHTLGMLTVCGERWEWNK